MEFPIDIILVTHNKMDNTIRCINALYKNTREAFKLTVIDDSTDETVEYEISARKTRKKSGYRILIVDDDIIIRNYLKEELGGDFSLLECSNGKDALDCVLNEKPDLVISDIRMDPMDGITLCRRLKSNPATRHLPLVLLTARSNDEDRAEGMEIGADAYFTKPFNTDLLKKSIYNLLKNRERIKIKYSPGGNINIEKKVFTSTDEALINKVLQIIEKHLGDTSFNTGILSREIGLSRVHLYRKLKSITGQTCSDIIRNVRLQKAAQLLESNKGFVKEIAFEVGFASLSHFSRCFHEYYGIKPSDYNQRSENR